MAKFDFYLRNMIGLGSLIPFHLFLKNSVIGNDKCNFYISLSLLRNCEVFYLHSG